MRQKVFTLLLLSVTSLLSCRKSPVEPNFKQNDQIQIDNYISVHGLTGMKRDKSGGDTTGMYYQIINPGDSVYNGIPIPRLDFPDKIAFVFSLRTFDGKYVQSDTIANHVDDFLGHLTTAHSLPLGLQLGIYNILKHRGGSMRLLIPSHLAYGVSGYGSGSTQVSNTRIAGNQCLDYYVHVIGNIPTDNQRTYDEMVIRNYMQANGLSGYTKVSSIRDTINNITDTTNHYWYKILTPGTGTNPITDNSTITYNDTGQLFNGTIFDNENTTSVVPAPVFGFVSGVKQALEKYATVGTKISILIPSALGYGEVPYGSVPPNSCLRFTFTISAVTP